MDRNAQSESSNIELPVEQLAAKAQAKPRRRNPLKPIPLKPNDAHAVPESLPSYEPFANIPFEAWKPKITKKSPLQILLHFLDEECLKILVEGINSYAALERFHPEQYNARRWHPVNQGELLQRLSLRLIMARTIEKKRENYWHDS